MDPRYRFSCLLCDKTYKRNDHLLRHVRGAHGGVRYTCPLCHNDFCRHEHLYRHMATAHSVSRRPQHQDEGAEHPAIMRMPHSVNRSPQAKAAEPPVITDISSDEEEEPPWWWLHQQMYPFRTYSCLLCERPFKRHDHLLRHVRSVHGGVRYSCPSCHNVFSRPDHLHRHMSTVHSDNRPPQPQEDEGAEHPVIIQISPHLHRHMSTAHSVHRSPQRQAVEPPVIIDISSDDEEEEPPSKDVPVVSPPAASTAPHTSSAPGEWLPLAICITMVTVANLIALTERFRKGKEVRKKWTGLRDHYNKSRKMGKESSSRFKALDFLSKVYDEKDKQNTIFSSPNKDKLVEGPRILVDPDAETQLNFSFLSDGEGSSSFDNNQSNSQPPEEPRPTHVSSCPTGESAETIGNGFHVQPIKIKEECDSLGISSDGRLREDLFANHGQSLGNVEQQPSSSVQARATEPEAKQTSRGVKRPLEEDENDEAHQFLEWIKSLTKDLDHSKHQKFSSEILQLVEPLGNYLNDSEMKDLNFKILQTILSCTKSFDKHKMLGLRTKILSLVQNIV